MTCEICGKPIAEKDYCALDIGIHFQCSEVISNMVENRKKQKEKLDEIIDHMNEIHEKILNVQGTIDQDVLEVIQKLEKFKEEEL